jgi:hypothetical protein
MRTPRNDVGNKKHHKFVFIRISRAFSFWQTVQEMVSEGPQQVSPKASLLTKTPSGKF